MQRRRNSFNSVVESIDEYFQKLSVCQSTFLLFNVGKKTLSVLEGIKNEVMNIDEDSYHNICDHLDNHCP